MSRGPDESDEKGEEEKNAKEEVKEKVEDEEEWTMDSLLGFGWFHHFQIWVVQTVVAILGKLALRPAKTGSKGFDKKKNLYTYCTFFCPFSQAELF